MAERIISADSHVLITPERVLEHLPDRYHDDHKALGARAAERMVAMMGGQAAQPKLRNKPEGVRRAAEVPRSYEMPWPAAGRPGEHDPVERLRDMDADQVEAEVLYTDISAGAAFYELDDEACLASFQAFNSAAAEWASVAPDRLVPVYLLPVHDIEASLKEAQRIAGEGARAVIIPSYPTDVGLAPYWDEVYDPLFSALEEMQIPISQHVGTSKAMNEIIRWDPTPARAVYASIPPIFMAELVGSWLLTGIFERHPNLHVVMVEAGLGWIPYYLQRMDGMRYRHGWDRIGMPISENPSFYWHRNMAATFEEDEIGMALRHELGVDNMLWATDYPHPDSTWPESQKVLAEHFEGIPTEETRKIAAGNAARLYSL